MHSVAWASSGTIVAPSRVCCATLHTVQRSMQHSAVRLHMLNSWCSCMAVTLSRLSTLFVALRAVWRKKHPAREAAPFVRPMLPWLPRDAPSACGSNFSRMRSLPAIIPSSANRLEMTGSLCLFSEEMQNP